LNPALRRYLREWRLRDPAEVQLRLAEVVSSCPEPEAPFRVTDRLTTEAEQTLVAGFMAGTSKRELAEQYGISESSVKRLLRRHGATRPRRYGRSD
jgi:DNA-directed RNA polymerase specialized sigma24 family protein